MTIQFPDVSHYQQGLALTGAVACIAKATEGTSFADPAYMGFKQQMVGRPFAAYHFLRRGNAAAQAAFAHSVVGSTPLMMDVETATDGSDATLQDMLTFADSYRAAGGIVTLSYIPHWYWQDHWGSPSLSGLTQRGIALVSSAYPAAGYSDNGIGWVSYGGVAPKIWQYTSSQLFNGFRCDFNAFKGTVEQLRGLFYGSAQSMGEVDMFLAQITGSQSVYFSDGQTYRNIINYATQKKLQAIGVQMIVVANKTELEDLCGQLWQPPTADAGGLTLAQVNEQIAGSTLHPPAVSP